MKKFLSPFVKLEVQAQGQQKSSRLSRLEREVESRGVFVKLETCVVEG